MKRYENMDPTRMKTFKDMQQWRKERKAKIKDLSFIVPQARTEIQFLQDNRTETTVTWIGHATFLLQMNGLNIVTDPVWAKWMGTERRLAEPGIPIADLPEIDIVLLSHSHYDHLHYRSIRKLKGNPAIFVPVGLKSSFYKKGFRNVQEMEWWEATTHKGMKMTFVPAQHWTRRSLFDTNASHWGGWVLEGNSTIYFVGDSGYFRGFKQIGEKFNIDCVLMPVGAYEPEWFMKDQHVSPEEAVQAFVDTKGKTLIPMHYGSYRLADDTPKEALDRLYAEWNRREFDDDSLKVLQHGETKRL